uniref:MACPF domain-containing protein n=1 Tax=Haptolina brevifila TaxID=156173 RepID=A0A7S2IK26_9EUKA
MPGVTSACSDLSSSCRSWANEGYCTESFVDYMEEHCKASCGLCSSPPPPPLAQPPMDIALGFLGAGCNALHAGGCLPINLPGSTETSFYPDLHISFDSSGVILDMSQSSLSSSSANSWDTTQQVASDSANNFDLSGSGVFRGVQFSGSTQYRTLSSNMRKNGVHYRYGYAHRTVKAFGAALSTSATPTMSTAFQASVDTLPTGPTHESIATMLDMASQLYTWLQFFNTYGTHYVSEVQLGGMLKTYATTTAGTVSSSACSSSDFNIQLKASMAKKFRGSTDYSSTSQACQDALSDSSSSSVLSLAYPPWRSDDSIDTWQQRALQSPQPIQTKLNPYSDILPASVLQAYSTSLQMYYNVCPASVNGICNGFGSCAIPATFDEVRDLICANYDCSAGNTSYLAMDMLLTGRGLTCNCDSGSLPDADGLCYPACPSNVHGEVCNGQGTCTKGFCSCTIDENGFGYMGDGCDTACGEHTFSGWISGSGGPFIGAASGGNSLDVCCNDATLWCQSTLSQYPSGLVTSASSQNNAVPEGWSTYTNAGSSKCYNWMFNCHAFTQITCRVGTGSCAASSSFTNATFDDSSSCMTTIVQPSDSPPTTLPEEFTSPLDIYPVLDQGSCGDCYAFAAAQVFRMRYGADGPAGSSFSPVQLVACGEGLLGCNGGSAWSMMDWMVNNGVGTCTGTCSTGCLPYDVSSFWKNAPILDECPSQCDDGSSITRFVPVSAQCLPQSYKPHRVHQIMQEILDNGPVSASIELYDDFDSFWSVNKTAVMTRPGCIFQGSHSVVITGWGTSISGVPYWKVKNSWGSSWGNNGYFFVKRGVNLLRIESSSICFTSDNKNIRWEDSNETESVAARVVKTGKWLTIDLPVDHHVFNHIDEANTATHENITITVILSSVQPVSGYQYDFIWSSTDATNGVSTAFRTVAHIHPNRSLGWVQTTQIVNGAVSHYWIGLWVAVGLLILSCFALFSYIAYLAKKRKLTKLFEEEFKPSQLQESGQPNIAIGDQELPPVTKA